MIEKVKEAFGPAEIICSECGRKVEVGEKFIAEFKLPAEKDLKVSRLDIAIARSAEKIVCEECLK